jgi:hypothetical protein
MKTASLAASAAALSASFACTAGMVTVTFQGMADGSIGATNFTGRAFTIFAQADSDSRQTRSGGGYELVHDMAFIAIDGVGSFMFFTSTKTFVDASSNIGFARSTSTFSLLKGDFAPTAAASWDMESGITTTASSGAAQFGTWTSPSFSILTSGGALALRADTSSEQVSFSAFAVPAPGSAALLGAAALIGMRRRRN